MVFGRQSNIQPYNLYNGNRSIAKKEYVNFVSSNVVVVATADIASVDGAYCAVVYTYICCVELGRLQIDEYFIMRPKRNTTNSNV